MEVSDSISRDDETKCQANTICFRRKHEGTWVLTLLILSLELSVLVSVTVLR